MGFLIWFDHQLFFLINNGLGSEWLDPIFTGLTSLGSWTIIIVAIALFSDQGKRAVKRHMIAILIALAVFAPITAGLKAAVDRPRPVSEFKTMVSQGMAQVRVVGDRLGRDSFPSGHSMLAFLIMVYVSLAKPGCRFWALTLASLVAFSRVYVGAHFPLDCLAGSALGAAGGWWGWFAHRKIFKDTD